MHSNPTLTLDYVPIGKNGTVTLTARLGDDVIAHEKVDLAKPAARAAFCANLCEGRKGTDPQAIENDLMKIAAAEATKRSRQADDAEERAPGDEPAALLAAMPDSCKAEAMAMLESPDLMKRIVTDIRAIGVAGEAQLAATVHLVGTSRQLSKPLAAIVQGPSSSGKSYTIEKVASLFPPEAVIAATSMTPQALFHMEPGSLEHRFVVAGERSRLETDERAEATRALREMLSGGRLTKLMPVKVGGEIVTKSIVQEGPIAFIESTTLATIFNEDANRCLMLTTDERTEQTKRIVTSLAKNYSGHAHEGDVQAIIQRHHALQRMLQRMNIVVPFAERLGELITHDKVEARRAFPQLMSMIQSSAMLHQRQRQIDSDGRLVATRDDYELAGHLLLKPLGRLLGGKLSDPATRFHERLSERFKAGETFTTKDVTKQETAYSDRAVRGWLVELHDAGRVEILEEPKGPKPAKWRLSPVDDDHDDQHHDLPTADKLFG
jgi:hypothetical protein